MTMPVTFQDYFKAYSCEDPAIRRIRLSNIQQKVNQAASQKRQKAFKRSLDQTHQHMIETTRDAQRAAGEGYQRHMEAMQEQARQNNMYRRSAGRMV